MPLPQDDHKGPPRAEVPPRPKSRHDMEDGYGVCRSSGRMGVKYLREFTKELDLMQWYDDVEDELQDASNDEYKCVDITPKPPASRSNESSGYSSRLSSHSYGLVGASLRLLMIHYSSSHP